MRVLLLLAEHGGRVVTKKQLLDEVWNGSFVEDSVLPCCIHQLRRALDDDARKPRYIETVPKIGYRLITRVQTPLIDSHQEEGSIATSAAEVESLPLVHTELQLPDTVSIAVLPFESLNGDEDYFANGITADLITRLAKLRDIMVIAQHSVSVYKDRPVDVRTAGRELGVRFVLEGSVQRVAARTRVHAHLIDTELGNTLWAEKYDGVAEDIFLIQDQITERIVTELNVQLMEGEQARVWRRSTEDLQAYEYYLQAIGKFFKLTPESNAEAAGLYRAAVEIDPEFALAYAMLGLCHAMDYRYSWKPSPELSLARVRELATKAIELDESLAMAHTLWGELRHAQGRAEEALASLTKAVSLSPGSSVQRAALANYLCYNAAPQEGLGQILKAMRLSPFYPAWYGMILGEAYRQLGRHDEAIITLRSTLRRTPYYLVAAIRLVASCVAAGQQQEAQLETRRIAELHPRFNLAAMRGGWGARALTYKDPIERARLVEALAASGLG